MKQITCGAVAILGVFALAGCYSYASQDINNGNYDLVQANPVFATMNVGDSDEIIFRLVNDANNGTLTSYSITGVPAGIAVHQILGYRPLFTNDTLNPTGDKTAQAYYIVGVTPGRYTFTVTPTSVNTSISGTVTVLVQPINLGNALSEHTGAAGDTVTITAPTGVSFTSTSAVTFTTGSVAKIGLSPDSTSLRVIAGPGITGPATITNVGQSSAPTVKVKTLVTNDSLTTPAITVAPTTLSAGATLGSPMTVTLGGGLRFTASSTILFGGSAVAILSRSADSSTATVVPIIVNNAVTAGAVTYTNIVLSFLNTVNISVAGNQSATVNTAVFDPNAGTIGTASTIALAASGGSIYVAGSGALINSAPCAVATSGDGCQWYKVVVAAPVTIDIDDRWQGGSDNGLYVLNSTGTSIVTSADANGQAPGNEPETKTATLPAGTYFFGQVFFGANSGYSPSANTVAPTYYLFKITTH